MKRHLTHEEHELNRTFTRFKRAQIKTLADANQETWKRDNERFRPEPEQVAPQPQPAAQPADNVRPS